MIAMIFIGIFYLFLGLLIYAVCETKFNEFCDKKREQIETIYLFGLAFYYIILLLLILGDQYG